MTALTERQKIAQALKDEIQRLGGFVISVPGSEKIRFEFLTGQQCNLALQKLRDLGFQPIFTSAGLRFHNDIGTPSNKYEIDIPAERQPVIDDRVIRDTELAKPER